MESVQLLSVNLTPISDKPFKLAECPRWDWRNKAWLWVDIANGELWRYRDNQLDVRGWDEQLGCFAMWRDEGFILAAKSGVYSLDCWEGERQLVAPLISEYPRMRFNDGRAAPSGHFVAGTRNGAKVGDQGQFYQLTADRQIQPMPMYAWTCNGLAFSPCGHYLYWADTGTSLVYRADYNPQTGEYGESQVFCDLTESDGRPDGASVDSEGGYWVAMYGGRSVLRISPEGKVTHKVPVPAESPTMVAFGGEDGKQMVITTAESADAAAQVFIADVEWQGLEEPLVTII
ncbi:SMP-30/gluconolactonase/LRE family protein [Photobacterium makurazakiensis]|uniref:SMP-30/gluconolactonase/LRE family protein n=1 Tax=Photobacterium makurazakiensis TaxID=2910234 RepID=UPI003D0C153B